MRIVCAHCGEASDKPTGAVRRAEKSCLPMFCNRECAGLHRRNGHTKEQKIEAKRLYDIAYREKNLHDIKDKKAEHYKRTCDRVKEEETRKRRMPKHVEYCRRPEYKEWKREYDRQYRAKEYGEFAECYLLALDIRRECLSRMDDYEIRVSKGTLNKSQQRRRDYDRAYSNNPEAGSLGNLE